MFFDKDNNTHSHTYTPTFSHTHAQPHTHGQKNTLEFVPASFCPEVVTRWTLDERNVQLGSDQKTSGHSWEHLQQSYGRQ